MNINLVPFVVVWIAVVLAVITLLFRHRSIAGKEDANLDVMETVSVAQQHVALEHKLAYVDKWGKILTAIAVIYGLAIAAFYVFQTFEQSSRGGF